MGHLVHLFFFVFLDVLGFSIILPLLPYQVTISGGTGRMVGVMLTGNALAQMITAPWLGGLSDRWGRRPVLMLCVLATCVSFTILASTDNLLLIVFSRILDGLLGGNISLAQAYIADLTNEKDRSKGFGVLGSAFGLAFIVGPATGAIVLSKYDSTKIPAMIAAALSLLNLISIWFRFHCPLEDVTPKLATLFWLRFSYGIIFSLFETTIGLYTSAVLHLSASSSNMFFVFVGVFFSGVQGYARRLSLANETKLIQYSFFFVGISISIKNHNNTINN